MKKGKAFLWLVSIFALFLNAIYLYIFFSNIVPHHSWGSTKLYQDMEDVLFFRLGIVVFFCGLLTFISIVFIITQLVISYQSASNKRFNLLKTLLLSFLIVSVVMILIPMM